MNCKEIMKKISEYVDGELNEQDCQSIKEHINNCPACQTFIQSFSNTIELCKDLLKADIPPETRQRLHQRLKEEYQNRSR
ncbi:anti-sigma factor family protein [candidate division CSSED10-310 bacterium]|uniref:Anti-sigma factor family protein n=1 Tax=candidate division CSSED10-310 bacterium TaxID=2855610 RepID=A0ABV6Z3M1_UNCC1